MAKLYAELTSDKGGRVVGKGGNDKIEILIKLGNDPHALITVLPSGTVVLDELSINCEFVNMNS